MVISTDVCWVLAVSGNVLGFETVKIGFVTFWGEIDLVIIISVKRTLWLQLPQFKWLIIQWKNDLKCVYLQ